MCNVQLPRSKTFDSQILMHYCTQHHDVSLDKQFQKHMSKYHHKYGVIDQGKCRKISSKRKWTDRAYHVQYKADIAHKDVKMYFDTNQFLVLPFYGPHPKHHGEKGLSQHYHLCFGPK